MRRTPYLCLAACLIASIASGQESATSLESRDQYIDEYADTPAPSPSAPVQLTEYTRTALVNNAALRAAFDRWRAQLERAPQVGALPDPMVSFTYFVEEIQTRTGPQESRFQLTQRIPWLAKLRRQSEVAENEAESLWWLVEAGILEVQRDVAVAYADYANLAQSVRILEQNLQLLKNLEPVVQRLIQTGGRQEDLLRLQVEIGKIENELESQMERRASLSRRLESIMNADSANMLPWPEPLTDSTRRYDIGSLRPRTASQNPHLRSLDYKIDAADSRIDLAKAAGRPDFTVGLSYIETGSAVVSPRPSDSGDDPVLFTVGLSLPVGRAKYRAGMREAHALKSAALNNRTQLRHDLLWRLEHTVYELQDAARQISLFRDTLIPRGRQALELTEVSYESGSASLLDLIDSQRELLDFELSFWKAVRDFHQKEAELVFICGGSLP